MPLLAEGSTGTAVHFKPAADVEALHADSAPLLSAASTPWLAVNVFDERR